MNIPQKRKNKIENEFKAGEKINRLCATDELCALGLSSNGIGYRGYGALWQAWLVQTTWPC